MTLEEIKAEITRLSVRERVEIRSWLGEFHDDEWDEQMNSDATSGRLDFLLDQANQAKDEDELRDIP